MSDIRDNPPPLPNPDVIGVGYRRRTDTQVREIEAAAFSRGVAAGQASMQGEIDFLKETIQDLRDQWDREIDVIAERDELRAKLKSLEEQKPVAWYEPITQSVMRDDDYWSNRYAQENGSWFRLYLAAGAKP